MKHRHLVAAVTIAVAAASLTGCSSTSQALPSLTAQGAYIVPPSTGTGSKSLGTFDAATDTVYVAITCHGGGDVVLTLPPSTVSVDAGCTSPSKKGGQIASRTIALDSTTGKVKAVVKASKDDSWSLLVSKSK
ncbi:hypothetical protein DEI93_02185 [Curtobacterium sp. MCBD17_035]|uniref:hypothetical protein n=1 Tax=Curtobacterium sp. MCBD17_035 TaxID=2175673 RepID=UPI0011B5349C|nr:hypothetical protein [Curtobacterium sp. MCBD17_035]WIB67871.1 hypothetical protein DEI93_02185 [Curtobacterium sp. MCBD17_035]